MWLWYVYCIYSFNARFNYDVIMLFLLRYLIVIVPTEIKWTKYKLSFIMFGLCARIFLEFNIRMDFQINNPKQTISYATKHIFKLHYQKKNKYYVKTSSNFNSFIQILSNIRQQNFVKQTKIQNNIEARLFNSWRFNIEFYSIFIWHLPPRTQSRLLISWGEAIYLNDVSYFL